MRKSRQSSASPRATSRSKSARTPDTAGKKSSSVSAGSLRVATPQGQRAKILRELELIVPAGIPTDERHVPLDLTGESSVKVGHIHSEFNARLAYAVTNAGLIEGHLIELRRAARIMRAEFHVVRLDEKKTDRDVEATLDKHIKEVEDLIAVEEAKLKILDGVIQGYTKIVEGASREITRRENERASRGD